VQSKDGIDGLSIDPLRGIGHAVDDPVRLGSLLELEEVLLASPAVHRHDGDEPAARDEPDEQQPPLELRHPAEG